MCSILASSCVQGPWAGARMFEMLAAQDMEACFWLVELFRDGGEETKKRLGSRSTRLRFELCTSACETYMMQFLLKIFRSVLNLLSVELPDSRGIFVRLESQTVWMKNDDWICTWSRKLHDRPRVHSTSHPADERDTPVQRLDTGHNTLLLPTGHFEMEKRWPIFLLDLASCTTVHMALSSARTVCGSQLMRGSQPFRRLNTTHFYFPFLVCCA